MQIKTRVSIVIPVYNEEDRIADCLEAIERQSVRPFEVIVVDNNSTDDTAIIAARFPFVTLLTESRQGVVYARDRGFSAARGDIIGRIDGDTLLPKNWTKVVQQIFADQAVDVVSGVIHLRDVSLARLASRIDLFWRRRMANQLGEHVAMQGANMALRRSVWQSIKNEVCHTSGEHEDFDLSIHAQQRGFTLQFDERLHASICCRRGASGFKDFMAYALIGPRTYTNHGIWQGLYMYQVVLFVALLYPVIVTMTRGYDEQLGRFSIITLFSGVGSRVNPATFMD